MGKGTKYVTKISIIRVKKTGYDKQIKRILVKQMNTKRKIPVT